ncbi:MAG: hypothetical protein U0414_25195 [Polyangiaceae bacterium]
MAEDVIVVDGDKIQITIDPPTLVPDLVAPVALVANGFSKINDKKVCIEGDELPPSLKVPLMYTSPPYVTPGMGTVTLTLKSGNKSRVSKDKEKKMLLKGQTFDAKFEVKSPAQQPSPTGPVPDSNTSYSGTAQFISANKLAKTE